MFVVYFKSAFSFLFFFRTNQEIRTVKALLCVVVKAKNRQKQASQKHKTDLKLKVFQNKYFQNKQKYVLCGSGFSD